MKRPVEPFFAKHISWSNLLYMPSVAL